jgi:hypothetical protein
MVLFKGSIEKYRSNLLIVKKMKKIHDIRKY